MRKYALSTRMAIFVSLFGIMFFAIGMIFVLPFWFSPESPQLVSEGILHDITYKTITIGDNIVLTNANPVTITDENDKAVERAVKDTYYYLYKQGKLYHLTPWKIHSAEGGSHIEQ